MSNFHRLVKKTEKFLQDNSPQILTAIGVTGTITTAYLTGKAAVKAQRILDTEIQQDRTFKKDFELTWKLYIPAVTTGILTCAAIIGANRIGTRRAAAVAAAYSLSERAFSEYKEKVVEQIGKNKEQKVRDEIAQERVTANPVGKQQIVVTGGGDSLCFDQYTGRYFNSSMEALKKAQNDLNYQLMNDGYASLNELYSKMGLNHIPVGEEVGWNSDNLLEMSFTSVLSEDDRPCLCVDFHVVPVRDFYRFR